jgi:hypothetical protein
LNSNATGYVINNSGRHLGWLVTHVADACALRRTHLVSSHRAFDYSLGGP